MTEYSLREISDAVVAALVNVDFDFSGDLKDAQSKTLFRARTLRERGVIKSTSVAQQGKVTLYNEADVAAAALAISASRDGISLNIITQIQDDLRPFTKRERDDVFREFLPLIEANKPVEVIVSIYKIPTPDAKAEMGQNLLPVDGSSTWICFDLTGVAKPVLDHLRAAK